LKKATMGQFNYPKSTYALYKSAEIHTKNTFKKPWWIWLPVAAIPVAVWAIPGAVGGLGNVVGGKGVTTAPAKPAAAASAPVAPASRPLEQVPAQLPVAPDPATAIPPASAASAPKWSGCIAVRNRCTCYASDGQKAAAEPGMCEDHTGAGLPAKAAEIPASLDRFAAPAVMPLDPHAAALIAWAKREADRTRAGR
jgi:zona occludens toxin